MRDMKHIAKLDLVAAELRKKAADAKANFEKHLRSYEGDPYRCMEWGNGLFDDAAKFRVFTVMAHLCDAAIEHRKEANEGDGMDVTMEDLVCWSRNEFFLDPVPNSTSATSNLLDCHLCKEVLDFQRERHVSWFHEAQYADPEWKAWANEQHRLQQASKLAREAAEEQARKDSERARYRVTTAIGKKKEPDPIDVLMGWPTAADAKRIRGPLLRAVVEAAHSKKAEG